MKKVAVIGAGIGGLAAAIRLAARGYEVTVYEKNDRPGGKLSELRLGAYRFDTGPSLFTLPELTEELFSKCREKAEERLPYNRLDNNCRYFFPDGTVFDFHHDREKLELEIAEKTSEQPATVARRLHKAGEAYGIGAPVFLFSAFHKLSNFTTPPYKKVVFKLHKLDFLHTMHGANRRQFSDPRMIQLFDRYATYNGSDPYRAPATLNMIAHLENNLGAYFPEKGMYAIAECLHELAVGQGVVFRFNIPVEEIVVEQKQATGVRTAEGIEPYDIIVSDADVRYAAEHLLKRHPLRKRLRRAEPSSSALIFYWGIDRTFDELELHNILFSGDYREEFRKLFRERTLTDDPTVYLFISSKAVAGDAPAGGENWFVMVNAPADSGQDWDQLVSRARQNIVEKIDRTLGTDIEKHIVEEAVASPQTIEAQTFSPGGALYGTASNSKMAAFLRHPNFLRSIRNLYFVGGSVHPGGGIPLCLASAEIVEREIALKHDKQ